MRILILDRPRGAVGYITEGWRNCLVDRGHTVARWDGERGSWERFDPDVYLGSSTYQQPIPDDRGSCKVALQVNPYGPVKVADISERPVNIFWALRQRPDLVFGYGREEDRHFWSFWTEKEGIPWAPSPTAGDAMVYLPHDEAAKVLDVVYVGGYWAYKGRSIDKFLTPLFQDPRLRCKLFGAGTWPPGVSSGNIADDQVTHFLGAGRVAPCISEPHTHTYGFDLPERIFKAALSGALVVHDPALGVERYLPSVLVGRDPAEFAALCVHYSRPENREERTALQASQRREVLDGQTYHHRMRVLLDALGFKEAAERMVVAS